MVLLCGFFFDLQAGGLYDRALVASAVRAIAMRHDRGLAAGADRDLARLKGQVRAAASYLRFSMMFDWYSTHRKIEL